MINSFKTYADLSPDIKLRNRVNRLLRDRPALSADEWYKTFWQMRGVSQQAADFVYVYMQQYSGLEFARVQPDDRLNEDLHLPLVCWFDWELTLCNDFWQCFAVDLSDRFDSQTLISIEELVTFLNHHLLSVNHS